MVKVQVRRKVVAKPTKPATTVVEAEPIKAELKPFKKLDTGVVHIELEGKPLPQLLADIMCYWKFLGNEWMSCMEADLKLFSKEIEVGSEIPINAVRALIFFDYMMEQRNGYDDLWVTRYKLTKKGLDLLSKKDIVVEKVMPIVPVSVKAIATKPATKKPKKIECPECDGLGVDEDGEECEVCDGFGEIDASNEVSLPEKPKAAIRIPVKRKVAK